MVGTYRELLDVYMVANYLNKTPLYEVNPMENKYFVPNENLYLGIKVMQNIDSVKDHLIKRDFFERCRQFLITSCIQIKKRYDFENLLYSNIKMLQKENIKKHTTLLPLMKVVPRILDSENIELLQKIDDQWRKLSSFENSSEMSNNIDEFYFQLSNKKDFNDEFLFVDLCNFVFQILALPHSSAACERIFSKINLIKTKSRNRLITDSINGLILTSQLIQMEGNCVRFQPNKKNLNLIEFLISLRKYLVF
ncbi:hypothetical protein ABEB36_015310 [Hypothenemus hampei]|uniref:HAT C-terminal dimerisation domain-containing protein n=1 Tax=Hypothenemus hampei TaxID=57062 RepID=A0ABD1E036_HYPHA